MLCRKAPARPPTASSPTPPTPAPLTFAMSARYGEVRPASDAAPNLRSWRRRPSRRVASDGAVARERERQRRVLAFLYSTPAYAPALERRGWSDLPDRLRALVRTEQWDDLPTVLSDEVLDELVICGRYDELPGILMAKRAESPTVLPRLGDANDDAQLRACIAELKSPTLDRRDRSRRGVGEEPSRSRSNWSRSAADQPERARSR